jgi:hypothetical protein
MILERDGEKGLPRVGVEKTETSAEACGRRQKEMNR